MAAYRRVHDLAVACRLTACTPGSAPGPTLGIEYGKPLPLPFLCWWECVCVCGCMCLCMSQVQHDYAEYQRELVAAAPPPPAAVPAGAATLMTGLPPQSKSTSEPPAQFSAHVTQLSFLSGGRRTAAEL